MTDQGCDVRPITDWRFDVEARTNWYVDENKRLRAEIARLSERVEFYRDQWEKSQRAHNKEAVQQHDRIDELERERDEAKRQARAQFKRANHVLALHDELERERDEAVKAARDETDQFWTKQANEKLHRAVTAEAEQERLREAAQFVLPVLQEYSIGADDQGWQTAACRMHEAHEVLARALAPSDAAPQEGQ